MAYWCCGDAPVKQITSPTRSKSRNLTVVLLQAQDFGGSSNRVSISLVVNKVDCLNHLAPSSQELKPARYLANKHSIHYWKSVTHYEHVALLACIHFKHSKNNVIKVWMQRFFWKEDRDTYWDKRNINEHAYWLTEMYREGISFGCVCKLVLLIASIFITIARR